MLDQFEADVVPALVEFGKDLAALDVDAMIFMARKSLCLFDVLRLAGAPAPTANILSDRVLQTDVAALNGHRLALIDDTLIIGTTLARAHRQVERLASTQVSTHVFARNSDWASEKLIVPDTVWLDLDEHRTRTFCAAEVRAFAVAPRPYLSDFPFFEQVELEDRDLPLLLTSIEWSAKNLTSALQQQRGVSVYTFFPTDTVLRQLGNHLGDDVLNLIDIAKVRAFASHAEQPSRLLVVPLVTLRPMTCENAGILCNELLARLVDDEDRRVLLGHINSSEARQRLAQWILSAAIGHRFLSPWPEGLTLPAVVDANETDRHFGWWLHGPMARLGAAAADLLSAERAPTPLPPIAPASLPEHAQALADESLVPFVEGAPPQPGRRVVTDFSEVFLHMYRTRELPAREQALELGKRVLDATPAEAPHRDRLESGVAWESIVAALCRRYDAPATQETLNTFSLVLDTCNDLGIAVPVTAVRDGVVFRSWRHGEDVLFAEQELALARSAVVGALRATGRESLSRLHLEKLLVILIHAGVARRFLQPHHWPGGAMQVASVRFELRGAVPKIVTGPPTRGDRDPWLSDYLVERNVLVEDDQRQYRLGDEQADSRVYALGEDVEAAYVRSDAGDEAEELGLITGSLLHFGEAGGDAPLRDRDLIVLASCYPPRNVAAAIQAELDILLRFLHGELGRFASLDLRDTTAAAAALAVLRSAHGREALFSARMKYVAHRDGEHHALVERCAAYLAEHHELAGPFAGRRWASYWNAMAELVPTQERERVDAALPAAMRIVYSAFLLLSTVEAAIAAAAGDRAAYHQACDRVLDAEMEAGRLDIAVDAVLAQRFRELRATDPASLRTEHARDYGVQRLRELVEGCRATIDSLTPLVVEFGRFAGMREMEYVVWWDIVDSLGEQLARRGGDISRFRGEQLPAFRDLVAARLRSLTVAARSHGVDLHCWDGTVDSHNDQKHAYVAGPDAIAWVGRVLGELHACLAACPSVRVRACAVPCRLGSGTAHVYGRDSEVRGDAHLETMSRLTAKVKEIGGPETESGSYLLVGGERLMDGLRLDGLRYEPHAIQRLELEVGASSCRIFVQGGAFGPELAAA